MSIWSWGEWLWFANSLVLGQQERLHATCMLSSSYLSVNCTFGLCSHCTRIVTQSVVKQIRLLYTLGTLLLEQFCSRAGLLCSIFKRRGSCNTTEHLFLFTLYHISICNAPFHYPVQCEYSLGCFWQVSFSSQCTLLTLPWNCSPGLKSWKVLKWHHSRCLLKSLSCLASYDQYA